MELSQKDPFDRFMDDFIPGDAWTHLGAIIGMILWGFIIYGWQQTGASFGGSFLQVLPFALGTMFLYSCLWLGAEGYFTQTGILKGLLCVILLTTVMLTLAPPYFLVIFCISCIVDPAPQY